MKAVVLARRQQCVRSCIGFTGGRQGIGKAQAAAGGAPEGAACCQAVHHRRLIHLCAVWNYDL